jgi:hypothetical protein
MPDLRLHGRHPAENGSSLQDSCATDWFVVAAFTIMGTFGPPPQNRWQSFPRHESVEGGGTVRVNILAIFTSVLAGFRLSPAKIFLGPGLPVHRRGVLSPGSTFGFSLHGPESL